jgi:hypothetical protein
MCRPMRFEPLLLRLREKVIVDSSEIADLHC